MKQYNEHKFNQLRKKYPLFEYFSYQIEVDARTITMFFDFRVGESLKFQPQMVLHLGNHARASLAYEDLDGLVWHIGLIELLSYWKSTCSADIQVRGGFLTPEQEKWWKKLYYHGLGEFFYQNGISVEEDNFVKFVQDLSSARYLSSQFKYKKQPQSTRVIVPIGGGKDSVVTLEMLKTSREVIPFIINPRQASWDCLEIAGFSREDAVVLERVIDPKLLELNRDGFLNGHTPFSAMLAFYSLLVSYATETRDIALSNEASANEATIPGTRINHQYSKSIEFEQDFAAYVKTYMGDCAHYYSYLRKYNELWIAEKFAQYPDYFPVFRSCNAGSFQNRWCGKCAKCLFTAIILSPFLSENTLFRIFGKDMLDDADLLPLFEELTGMAKEKPFECVGTIAEVNDAVKRVIEKYKGKYLIEEYCKRVNL
ncbi:MAG: hypothetical protein LBR51_06410 [Bacteroidales bacterium]|jgi:hypothetical protein|nr:hypothetical protein [Bacteroidales bacterium]